MRPAFYSENAYRREQSEAVRQAWREGKYSALITPLQKRICKNPLCSISFEVKPYNPRVFCSNSCSATVSNKNRRHSIETRNKIALAIKRLPSGTWKRNSMPLVSVSCKACSRLFSIYPYLVKRRKYCSVYCAIRVVGAQTTSPKASKGKSGVRIDIDQNIIFYSTWEANVARVFNLVGLNWEYAPTIFDLGKHTYRPDFYLPEYKIYVEVKNFMGDYSKKRDALFRHKFPDLQLELIMKDDYLELEANYKALIENWE